MSGRMAGWTAAALFLLLGPRAEVMGAEPAAALGLFEGQSDVGSAAPPGTGAYDSRTDVYTLTSAGANTWYRVDAFHYVWKRVTGDFALTAQIAFPPHRYAHEPNPHRKGILMFRESLDPGSTYAAVAEHGSGMTALQYRDERGANTQDIELNIEAPQTVRIERRGATFTMLLSMKGEPLHPVGASIALHLSDPLYVGLGALSHDGATTDEVEFSRVTLRPLAPVSGAVRRVPYSTLQTIQTEDEFRRAMLVRAVPAYVQSPNWAPDGRSLYVQEAGHIERIPYLTPPAGGPPQVIETGSLVDCSGNFGLSPDGKSLAVSCAEREHGPHQVYLLAARGHGAIRQVTTGTASSFFHAWSPDSRRIAFTRGSAGRADIFTIAARGGAEVRLTRDTVNDAPDYSPDGKFIYFDSSRSGSTQIWRMAPDGSGAEQLTDDAHCNSSPHMSPDGKTVAFLRQPPGCSLDMGPASIELLSTGDGLIRELVSFQGNRGSLSMYGWGDADHLAFVSYRMLPAPDARPSDAPPSGARQSDAPSSRAPAPGAQHPSDGGRPLITGVSHIAVYASDAKRSERFYVHDLGAVEGADPETPSGTRYYFAPTQFVEVLPLPRGTRSINRLDHVAFSTADAEGLREYLASRAVAVPARVARGRDGSRWFDVLDPEGNKIEFVQPAPAAPDVPLNPLSHHIIHVGFIVHDRAREDRFFRAVLGFRPYWFGGSRDDEATWISQQVPDGTDWLEYMIVGTPQGRGIPATMTRGELGVLDHFSLGIVSTEAAYTLLWNGGRLAGQTNVPKIGRDAKWQLNLIDPDGTRAELMELHAVGKPCCSPFTASDPQE